MIQKCALALRKMQLRKLENWILLRIWLQKLKNGWSMEADDFSVKILPDMEELWPSMACLSTKQLIPSYHPPRSYSNLVW